MNKLANKQLISEIALRCADTKYTDFDYNIYERALLRADREIAKKYQILNKVYQANINSNEETTLSIDNFRAEYLVACGENQLRKVTHKIEPLMGFCYYLELVDGKLKFAYKLGDIYNDLEQRFNNLNDSFSASCASAAVIDNTPHDIIILYTVIPNADAYTDSNYLIPEIYDEERIEKGINYIAKLGVAKFTGDIKVKYAELFKMTNSNSDYDKNIVKDNAWVTLKTFDYLGD